MNKIITRCTDKACRTLEFCGLEKELYAAGETICFSVKAEPSTDYRITSPQADIRCEAYAGGIGSFSFIMPDTDVVIDAEARAGTLYTGPCSPVVSGPGPKPAAIPGAPGLFFGFKA